MNDAPARRRARRRAVPHRFTVIQGGRGTPPRSVVDPPEVAASPLLIYLVLGFETLFFTALLTVAMALRAVSPRWPPPTMPPLPIAATSVHTAILLFSAFTMRRAMAALRAGKRFELEAALAATALLGFAFVAGQAAEAVLLTYRGLAPATDSYAAAFLALVGATGAHVLGGMLWVIVVTTVVGVGTNVAPDSRFVRSCAAFWYYGCALWLPVFVLLYLL